MKKKILLSALCITLGTATYAQIGGLNKLKDKATGSVKKENVNNAVKEEAEKKGAGMEDAAREAERNIGFISSANTWDKVNNVPMGYNEYVKMRDAYKANPKNQKTYLDKLPACDSYYSEWIPKALGEKVIPDLTKTQAECKKSEKSNPKWVVQKSDAALKTIEMYLLAKPGDPSLEKHKQEFEQLKKEMEDYIASGGDKKYEEDLKAQKIADARMPKAAAKNEEWEKAAKDLIENASEGGPVLRVSLVSTGWKIEKNDLGIPLRRSQKMYVAYKSKKTGRCYYKQVDACQQYAGGGTYNEKTYFLPYDKKTELNCENVDKE